MTGILLIVIGALWLWACVAIASALMRRIPVQQIREISTNRLTVRWYQFGYSTFDQNRTLLGAPSGQACYFFGDFGLPQNQAKYFAN